MAAESYAQTQAGPIGQIPQFLDSADFQLADPLA